MVTRARRSALVVLLAGVAAASGCGGSGDGTTATAPAAPATTAGTTTAATAPTTTTPTARAAFAVDANTICRPAYRTQRALAKRGLGILKQEQGLAKQVVALAPLIDRGAALTRKLHDDLGALTPPADAERAFTAYLKVLTDRRVLTARLADAGRAADTARYRATAKRLDTNTADGRRLTKRLGLTDCP